MSREFDLAAIRWAGCSFIRVLREFSEPPEVTIVDYVAAAVAVEA